MTNVKNSPAMKIAAAVASYSSSPRHSFVNMIFACVKSYRITVSHFPLRHLSSKKLNLHERRPWR